MHPVLLKIGSISIYSYSVFTVIGFVAFFTYLYLEARRLGEDIDRAIDIAFYIFISSLFGARLLHIIMEWENFWDDPLAIFKIWQGGLVFYGGFFTGIATSILFIKYYKLHLGKWADMIAPVPMIALTFGRIGCFLNGCCYGSAAPEGLPWAVVYPLERMPLSLAGVPLHPTPIYSSITVALIAAFLIFLSRKKRYHGQVVWTMTLLYSIARFILEYFRADPRGEFPALGLSTSQAIGIPVMLVSAGALIYLEIKHRSSGSGNKPGQEAS